MNIEEKLKEIYNEEIVICVHSLEEDLNLRELLYKYNYKWCNNNSYLNNDEAGTSELIIKRDRSACYNIKKGQRGTTDWYKTKDLKIIDFEDLSTPINIKEKLSKAKIVDNKYLVLPEGKYIFKDNILYAIN